MQYKHPFKDYVAHDRVQWDAFRTFYVPGADCGPGGRRYNSLFVRFEDDGLALVGDCTKSDYRRFYPRLDIEIWSSNDNFANNKRRLTFFDPDGVGMTTTNLHATRSKRSDQQTFVVDYTLGRAYRLSALSKDSEPLPAYLHGRHVMAYYPAPGHPPITKPVRISEPYKPTVEEKQHIDTLRTAATMWAHQKGVHDILVNAGDLAVADLFSTDLDPGDLSIPDIRDRHHRTPTGHTAPTAPLIRQHFTFDQAMELEFGTMTDVQRMRLLRNGIWTPRVERFVPYLDVQIEKL